MSRVLMLSPFFPPDTSAAAHRVRLLAPHLPAHGWEPTVLSVDPRDYEGRLDPGLADLVPSNLRVVRCRALPIRWTRGFGIGDLGLRAFFGLWRAAADLLRRETYDALFITIYPSYPAILGPILKGRFAIPFVLDYQDPWVGAWGESVGGGPSNRPDLKSRITRALAERLEPRVARAADAITAVSNVTYEQVSRRYPDVRPRAWAAIPLGAEPADFDYLRRRPRSNPYFDPKDGLLHLCYVGTLLPLGRETLRAVLGATALVRRRRPDLYARLRLHFFGTGNQAAANVPARVIPIAREFGVDDCVDEIAPRIDYLDALTVQVQAGAILMMGSSEHHYTASKLYPGLLAERPILAVFHEMSSVVEHLRRVTSSPGARLITYSDAHRAESRAEEIFAALISLAQDPCPAPLTVDMHGLDGLSARAGARALASVLDRVRRR